METQHTSREVNFQILSFQILSFQFPLQNSMISENEKRNSHISKSISQILSISNVNLVKIVKFIINSLELLLFFIIILIVKSRNPRNILCNPMPTYTLGNIVQKFRRFWYTFLHWYWKFLFNFLFLAKMKIRSHVIQMYNISVWMCAIQTHTLNNLYYFYFFF